MSSFQEVFGGNNIYPSQPTYLLLSMSTSVVLQWPIEQAVAGNNLVADIIDVDASAPGLNVGLGDARQVSKGFTALFNNVGAQTVTVRDALGGTIISLASGTVWQIYLTDNSTEAGTWKVFQYGASVSVTNAAALAGAGLKAISTTLNQAYAIRLKNTNYTVLDSDRACALLWTGGAGNFTLPDHSVVGADWFTIVRNSGTGDLTVLGGGQLIDGLSSKTFSAGSSAFVICDGTNFFTVGFGTGGGGGGGIGFGFIEINVSGNGNYTLSGPELNQIGYRFVGTLTGQRDIIVPTAIQQYWITNSTTGAFAFFVRTAGQSPGVSFPSGEAVILYCDGVNVVNATSETSITLPLPINQGGTAATTAATARTNLGASATGSALFTAADPAAARSAISAANSAITVSAGAGLSGGGDLSANRTISLTTPIAIANGGTGATSAADARTALGTVPGTNDFGYLGLPQNIQNGNYTLVASDAGKHLYKTGGGTNTWTIPANASVAYPIGTTLTFINAAASTVANIAITSDTLRIAGGLNLTGTRQLINGGVATAIKVTSTSWFISGAGLS